MKWYYVVLSCVWAMIAGVDVSRGAWGAALLDLFFLAVVIGATVYFRQKEKKMTEGEAEVIRHLKSPPNQRIVDNLNLPGDEYAKKGVEPMPTPGDEFQRLVEAHIKGCRTCQVHEEGKSE